MFLRSRRRRPPWASKDRFGRSRSGRGGYNIPRRPPRAPGPSAGQSFRLSRLKTGHSLTWIGLVKDWNIFGPCLNGQSNQQWGEVMLITTLSSKAAATISTTKSKSSCPGPSCSTTTGAATANSATTAGDPTATASYSSTTAAAEPIKSTTASQSATSSSSSPIFGRWK